MGFLITNMKMAHSFHIKAFITLLILLFIFNKTAVSQENISTNNWKWVEISKAEALKLSSEPKNELKTENNKYFVKKPIQNLPPKPTQTTEKSQVTPAPTYWKRNPGFNSTEIKKFQDILEQEESDYNGPSKKNPIVKTKLGFEEYGVWPDAQPFTNPITKKTEYLYPYASKWFFLRYKNDRAAFLNDINVREIRVIGEYIETLQGNDRKLSRGDYGEVIGRLQTILVNNGLLATARFSVDKVDLGTYQAIARLMTGNNRVTDFGIDGPPTYNDVYNKLKEPKAPIQRETTTGSINPNKPKNNNSNTIDSTNLKSNIVLGSVAKQPTKYRHNIPNEVTIISYKACLDALSRYSEGVNEKIESGSIYKTKLVFNEFTQYEIDKVHVYRCIVSSKKPYNGSFGGEPNKRIGNMLTFVQSPYSVSNKFDVITLNE